MKTTNSHRIRLQVSLIEINFNSPFAIRKRQCDEFIFRLADGEELEQINDTKIESESRNYDNPDNDDTAGMQYQIL